MKIKEKHIVIGAGVAGCVTAIMKKKAGYDVVILEMKKSKDESVYPICTDTSNIVSENHSGAEYPFDPQSAKDCFDGRLDNNKFFPEFIYGGKSQSRIIASQSMIYDGVDIAEQCRNNMSVIKNHYRQRIHENFLNYMFGNPNTACREIGKFDGVEDVATAFVTPQRGFNTVFVSLTLEHEIKKLGIEVVQGAEVVDLKKEKNSYIVKYLQDDKENYIEAEQISICCATFGFGLATKINPNLKLPPIYLALREILYVDLPDGCEKNYTCLKLEDKYGGMMSPLSPNCALIYHPPSAHIQYQKLDFDTYAYPETYQRYMEKGHPELAERAETTLSQLKSYYPELRNSRVLKPFLKVAINTTHDSRQRRNMGVFRVDDGCSLMILPKWTMCVSDAKKDLVHSISHSIISGSITEEQAQTVFKTVSNYAIEVPEEWYQDKGTFIKTARLHAQNMGLPIDIAEGLSLGSKDIVNMLNLLSTKRAA